MAERRIGILIGNSRFPQEPKLENLRYPLNDVDGLENILSSKDRGAFDEIITLKDKPHHEVLQKLNLTFSSANKNDLVLVYYSGHGKVNNAGRLHLATVNTALNALESTAISIGMIRELIDISPTKKIVIMLDCCFSGAAGDEFLKGSVDDQLLLASKIRGTYIMTAATGIQVAKEKESDQHGIFTKHLIQGIQTGDADLDCSGHITMDELYSYVHEKVLAESHQQPMKWNLNVRGDLIIARSGKTSSTDRNRKLREIIFDLAKQGLPDDILDKARKIIAFAPEQITGNLCDYDRLLDQLLQQKLSPFEFIKAWYEIKNKTDDPQIQKLVHQQKKPPSLPSSPKWVYALLVIAAITAGIWIYFNFIKEDLAGRFEKVSLQLEQQALKAEQTSIPAQLEKIIQTRNDYFSLWEGLERKAVSKGVDTDPWKERMRLIDENWRKVVEARQSVFGWAGKFEQITTQLEQQAKGAAAASSQSQWEQIITTRNDYVRRWDAMEREASSSGFDTGPWKERFRSLENHWREMIANRQKTLEGSGAAEPSKKEPKPHSVKLFVETNPEDATVRIMNIGPPFHQGMELEPGRYHVQVSAESHNTEDLWVSLEADQDQRIEVRLDSKSLPSAAPGKPSERITNTLGMEFVYIAPGTFTMGSPKSEPQRDKGSSERQHPVALTQGFYMQTTEVTQGQWQALMESNPSSFKACGKDCPVENVSWNDAQDFIKKLNAKEGTVKYRLPTEAQWEYAARAGTQTPFAFGSCLSTEQANYNGNYPYDKCPKGSFRRTTVKVGSFQPNAWGLFDMHGNVYEWCQDWYGDYQEGHDPTGPSNGSGRVIRSGSWSDAAWGCRAASRAGWTAIARISIGFRLALLPGQ